MPASFTSRAERRAAQNPGDLLRTTRGERHTRLWESSPGSGLPFLHRGRGLSVQRGRGGLLGDRVRSPVCVSTQGGTPPCERRSRPYPCSLPLPWRCPPRRRPASGPGTLATSRAARRPARRVLLAIPTARRSARPAPLLPSRPLSPMKRRMRAAPMLDRHYELPVFRTVSARRDLAGRSQARVRSPGVSPRSSWASALFPATVAAYCASGRWRLHSTKRASGCSGPRRSHWTRRRS